MTKKILLTDQLNKDKKLFELDLGRTVTQEELDNRIEELFELLDNTQDEMQRDAIAEKIAKIGCSGKR